MGWQMELFERGGIAVGIGAECAVAVYFETYFARVGGAEIAVLSTTLTVM